MAGHSRWMRAGALIVLALMFAAIGAVSTDLPVMFLIGLPWSIFGYGAAASGATDRTVFVLFGFAVALNAGLLVLAFRGGDRLIDRHQRRR
jgi:hypothetical protein